MNKIFTWIKDWWRGYGQRDIESLCEKMDSERGPGAVIPLSKREYAAMVAGYGKRFGEVDLS